METINENNVSHMLLYVRNIEQLCDTMHWLADCIIKKQSRGKECNVDHLANCSTMKKLISGATKCCKADGVNITTAEKKHVANLLAREIFEEWI